MWLILKGVLGVVVGPIANYFTARQRRGQSKDTLEAKITMAKVNKEAKLELADHEVQVLRTKGAVDSWKDEYATIVVSIPILIATFGALVQVFWEDTGARLLQAANIIAEIMTGPTLDYSVIWLAVVGAALGLKRMLK